MKKATLYIFLLISFQGMFSQDTIKKKELAIDSLIKKLDTTQYQLMFIVVDGDTIPQVVLKEFNYQDPDFLREWTRAVYFVRRTYAYAMIVDSLVKAQDSLEKENLTNTKRQKRKTKRKDKKAKKSLKDKYTYDIKNLTNVRGDYLTRIIHKKTNYTTYHLIKKYKSGASALFWNSILWTFGSTNLKNKFDPQKDWMLNLVLKEVEAGKITPLSRAQILQEIKIQEARRKAAKKKK